MKVFWVSNKSVPFVVCILSSSFVVIWSAVRRSMCELNLVYALVEAAVSLRVSKIILQCELAYNNLCTFVNKGRGLWDRKLAHFGCLNYSVHAVERISLLSIKRLLKWAFKVYLENSRSKNALNSKITFQEMFKINFGFISWSSIVVAVVVVVVAGVSSEVAVVFESSSFSFWDQWCKTFTCCN